MVTDWSEERTGEEDEEQLVMRRLRNSVDDLRRGFRHLTYKVPPSSAWLRSNLHSISRWRR